MFRILLILVTFLCFSCAKEIPHCFTYSDEVKERYPNIEDTLYTVYAKWQINWDVKDTCPNIIIIQTTYKENGEINISNLGTADVGYNTAGDPYGLITINTYHVDNIKDVTEDECKKGELLLNTLLTHEVGHILGLPHSDEGVMRSSLWNCWDGYPTEENLAAVHDKLK